MKIPFVFSFLSLVTFLALGHQCQAAGRVTTPSEAALETALSGGGKVVFDCDATITFSSTKTIVEDTALDANGHAVTFSGGGQRRLFWVNEGKSLTLSGLRLQDGMSRGVNGANGATGTYSGPPSRPGEIEGTNGGDGAVGYGGAIVLRGGGQLFATECVFSNNFAYGGNGGSGGKYLNGSGYEGLNGGAGGDAAGGAICAISDQIHEWNLPATIILTKCTFSGNAVVAGSGGAGATGTVASGPGAWSGSGGSGNGGGRAVGGAVAFVYDDTVNLTTAAYYKALKVTSCLFDGNTVTGGNGGVGGGASPGMSGSPTPGEQIDGGFGGHGGSGGPGGSSNGGALFAYNALVVNTTLVRNKAFGGNGNVGKNGQNGASGALYQNGITNEVRLGSMGGGGSGGSGGYGGDALGGAVSASGGGVVQCTLFGNETHAGAGANGGKGGNGVVGHRFELPEGTVQSDTSPSGNGGQGGNGGNGWGGAIYNINYVDFCTLSTNGAFRGVAGEGGAKGVAGAGTIYETSLQALDGTDGNLGTAEGGAVSNSAIHACLIEKSSGGNVGVPSGNYDRGNNICDDATLPLQLQFTDSGIPDTVTSRNNTDPKLAPLGNNGGPLPTMALLAGSPAIDLSPRTLTSFPFIYDLDYLIADQRGYGRKGVPDAGAFEYQGRVRAQANPLVVTTTANRTDEFDNMTSLREAIDYANSHEGPDTITFAIEPDDAGFDAAKGVFLCAGGDAYNPLPAVSDSGTTIDGSSQTTFGGNTNVNGPEIGISPGYFSTLLIEADNCLVQGLWIPSGSLSIGIMGSRNTVRACFLGTDDAGIAPVEYSSTILSVGPFSTEDEPTRDGNILGGNSPADGNRIGSYIHIYKATNTLIRNNDIQSFDRGIDVVGSSGTLIRNNTVRAAQNPVILGASNGSVLENNDFTGYYGLLISEGSQRNSIRFNRIVHDPSSSSLAINFASTSTGLIPNDAGDADVGDNGLQNHPELGSAKKSGGTTTVSGTFNSKPNATFQLDFYVGEARESFYRDKPTAARFLGTTTVSTNATGNASFSFTTTEAVSLGEWITASATDASGNTSQLSPAIAAEKQVTVTVTPALRPSAPVTTDVLTVTPNVSVSDGSAVTLTYVWKKNGVVIPNEQTDTLQLNKPGNGDKNDVISCEVTATSASGGAATAAAQVTVVNSAPIAVSSQGSVDVATEKGFVLQAFDADGDALTFKRVGGPRNGVTADIRVDPADGKLKLFYKSRPKYGGVDIIRFVAFDSDNKQSNESTLGIRVLYTPPPPANRAPIAGDTNIDTYVGVSEIKGLLGSDPDGDAITFRVVGNAKYGSSVIKRDTDGAYKLFYTSLNRFYGNDSVTYLATDSRGKESNLATIGINFINRAPVAQGNKIGVASGALVSQYLFGTDADGDALTFRLVNNPRYGKGEVKLDPQGKWRFYYTSLPGYVGPDQITFIAIDPIGKESQVAAIDINVVRVTGSASGALQRGVAPSNGAS